MCRHKADRGAAGGVRRPVGVGAVEVPPGRGWRQTRGADGVFPHQRSLGDQPELEEERRLAYVGVTRARERLYVSRAMVRSAWGAPSHNPASRFLDELPVDLVDWRRTAEAQTRWGRPDLAANSAGAAGRADRGRSPQLLLGGRARRRDVQGQAGPRDPVAGAR